VGWQVVDVRLGGELLGKPQHPVRASSQGIGCMVRAGLD